MQRLLLIQIVSSGSSDNRHPLLPGPTQGYIGVPTKKAEAISFLEPLSKFISDELQQDPAQFSAAITELNDLRNRTVRSPSSGHTFL